MSSGRQDGGKKKVTVIIPNYNGLSFMEPCFKALDQQACRDFTVLVVDNGSTDGSVEWLKERGIPTLFLETNTGFSGAVNRGIQAADTPYVILLNNDTEPDVHYVGELLRAIERSPRIFSVSSKMIQLYHRDKMDDAGDMYSLLGWAFQRGVGQPSSGYTRPCRVFAACAGAAIYRRSVFEKIGYFDEMHFAYLEDIDLSYRARIRGYRILYCPEAEVYHVGSGTSGSRYNAFKVRLAARNNVYLNYKNMPLLQLLINLPGILLGVLIKQLFFLRIGFGKEYGKGFLEGLRTLPACRKVPFSWKNLPHYAAIELRLLAHLSGDEHLIRAFSEGEDFHAETAARVFGVPVDQVTRELRSRAKAVNFGIVYGQQAFGLASSLKIGRAEAQEMIDRYFEAYPGVRAFLDESVRRAHELGYAETLYGRKRHIKEFAQRNRQLVAFGERTAMNHPMQGTAADIIKIAMVRVAARLADEGLKSRLVLQIHDELDLEVPEGEVEAVSALVRETMEGVAQLRVPLVAEVSYGGNWAEAK